MANKKDSKPASVPVKGSDYKSDAVPSTPKKPPTPYDWIDRASPPKAEKKQPETKDEQLSKKNRVMIFGAGVAGLTAAHELSLRGFQVEVVDPAIQENLHRFTLDRGIGGMARSQWGCRHDQLKHSLASGFIRLGDGRDFLLDDVVIFAPPDANGDQTPTDQVLFDDLLERAARLLASGLPVDQLEIRTPIPQPDPCCFPELTKKEQDAQDEKINRMIAADGRVKAVRQKLKALWPNHDAEVDALPVLTDPYALEIRGAFKPNETWLFFTVRDVRIYAGEHGFRFFPSFYRHVFDTLRRIPIQYPRGHERARATVLDNLIPSDGLGFARRGKSKSFLVPRRPIRSIEEARRYMMLVLRELEYEVSDIQRFTSKLLKYMTSSIARRRAEYEDLPWGKFVEQEKFSTVAREHVEFGPQMSAALRGSQSDTRTQGNISAQLLMDQMRVGRPDCTLNAPTNGAWLDHWHTHLFDQGVKFRRGKLVGFETSRETVLPQVFFGTTKEGVTIDPSKVEVADCDYYVLALSLPAAVDVAEMLKKVEATPAKPHPDDNDVARIISFTGGAVNLKKDLERALPRGPLQHLSGIQFYFDNGIDFWRGHTQYLDSAWGLTSIAQPQFWSRPRDGTFPYRGILSVDIGIWDRAYASKKGNFKKTAWASTADEIAQHAWEQIEDHHDDAFRARYGTSVPKPVAYRLDSNIRFIGEDPDPNPNLRTKKVDASPFLVNRTSKYRGRPGRLIDGTRPDHHQHRQRHDKAHLPHVSKDVSFYDVYLDRYVWAGTFMKTYTRLTSMESANESARLAVNAILKHARTDAELCEIWDPEDNELDNLMWLKELDEKRFKDDRPHMMDTLDDLDPMLFSPCL